MPNEHLNPGNTAGTVDIHTHLLSPFVRFDRPFDRVAVRFFAKSLGTTAERLKQSSFEAYTEALTGAVRSSGHVDKVCLFGVDGRMDSMGKEVHRDQTVCSTTEDVLALWREHPDIIVPFFSVNPLRKDAVERVEEYVGRGCRGAKFLQNYWCVDLNDRRFGPYFDKLRELNIPLIIHIGSEYSIASCACYERLEMLRKPLDHGVTVIAAHMGLGRVMHKAAPWRNLSRNPMWFDRDYHALLDLLASEPNLYADISAILAPLRARALRHLSMQTEIHHKILFGTDYPVPYSTVYNTYDIPMAVRRQFACIANPFDRYVAIVSQYFPLGSPIYTNYKKVLTNVT